MVFGEDHPSRETFMYCMEACGRQQLEQMYTPLHTLSSELHNAPKEHLAVYFRARGSSVTVFLFSFSVLYGCRMSMWVRVAKRTQSLGKCVRTTRQLDSQLTVSPEGVSSRS